MSQAILYLVGLALGVSGLGLIIGMTRYDLEQVRVRAQQLRQPHLRQYNRRPTVTALLYIDRDTTWCQTAFTNLRASHYRKLEIILIFPPSLSRSVELHLASLRSRRSVHLYENRHNSLATATREAYQRFGSGELVAVFDSTHLPAGDFVSSAIQYFNQHNDASIALMRRSTISSFRMLGLLQQYSDFIQNITQKALCGLDTLPAPTASSGLIYRQLHFISDTPMTSTHRVYASSILILTPPAPSLVSLLKYRQSKERLVLQTLRQHIDHPAHLFDRIVSIGLLAGRIAMGVLPFLIGYFIFMAVQLHQPFFLSIVLAAYCGILLFAIWESEDTKLLQKIVYTALSPITLVPVYLLSFLAVVSLMRELLSLRPSPAIRLPDNAN